jgi:hypothetical protein
LPREVAIDGVGPEFVALPRDPDHDQKRTVTAVDTGEEGGRWRRDAEVVVGAVDDCPAPLLDAVLDVERPQRVPVRIEHVLWADDRVPI